MTDIYEIYSGHDNKLMGDIDLKEGDSNGLTDESWAKVWEYIEFIIGEKSWNAISDELEGVQAENDVIQIRYEKSPKDCLFTLIKQEKKKLDKDFCKRCNCRGEFVRMSLLCPVCGVILGGI